MPLNDDDHRVARRIKELENRIADLEDRSRSSSQPNFLVTLEDDVTVGDSVDSVQTHTFSTGAWGNTGWGVSTWGDV